MKTHISLKEFMQAISEIKKMSENCIKHYMEDYYIRKAVFINKTYGIELKQALEMFYYAEYLVDIKISFSIYGLNNLLYIKKPNIFKRIFKKYTIYQVALLHNNIFIDDRCIDSVEADNIKIVFK